MSHQLLCGDWIMLLGSLPDASVQSCVTSPPYWGLRDYGVEGQLGLEKTPEEYVVKVVAGFREVRRVLRKDGTLWLNLGDSYSQCGNGIGSGKQLTNPGAPIQSRKAPKGLKPKDLVGIPWAVATALRDPYYAGRIKNIHDRIWLAAMIDGEGCMFIHKRGAGLSNGQGYTRKNATFGSGLEVANTSEAIVQRCMDIAQAGSICCQAKDRRQPLFRWNLRSNECREIIREIYPWLVGKQHQARLLLACPSSGERAEAAHEALIHLHNGHPTDVDFPAPESMFEPGWYLRQDLIWSKSNPMPESVRDRCTKSHEYVFLLSKSERYYYDIDAVKEPVSGNAHARGDGVNPKAKAFGPYSRVNVSYAPKSGQPQSRQNESFSAAVNGLVDERNKRSVWTVATAPYPEAHFATYPEELITPMILAGCPEGGTVLDPFAGSGTTLAVAERLGRDSIGIELNPEYVRLAQKRIEGITPAMRFTA